MRHIILIAIICTTSLAISEISAQSGDPVHAEKQMQSYLGNFEKDDKRKFYIQEVVKSEGATREQLFSALNVWTTEHFEEGDSSIEIDDRDSGILMARGWTSPGSNADGSTTKMYYSIKFEIRDGKYRYKIYHVEFDNQPFKTKDGRTPTLTDMIDRSYDENEHIEVNAHYTCVSEALQSLVESKRSLMSLDIGLLESDSVK